MQRSGRAASKAGAGLCGRFRTADGHVSARTTLPCQDGQLLDEASSASLLRNHGHHTFFAIAAKLGKKQLFQPWLPSCHFRRLSSFYDVTVEKFAAKPIETVSLRQMLAFGESVKDEESRILKSARFVQRELPIRLAKRLLDLQFLPYIVVTNPHIKQVYNAYHRAFQLLREFPQVKSMEENLKLTSLLEQLVDEQTPLLSVLAKGVRECASRPLVGRELDLDGFLDSMLQSRISRRVIAEQHICLQTRREGFIGVIHTQLSVVAAVNRAVLQCQEVCRETYGVHPQFSVVGDTDTTVAYIPAHLDYMLFEILKNASRALVEYHSHQARRLGRLPPSASHAMPPIVICICCGVREVAIKVSDQGGGIDEAQQEKVWKYGYTTAEDSMMGEEDLMVGGAGHYSYGVGDVSSYRQNNPMAGLGFGLPLSRLHAQYFGGGMQMVSVQGYGTDVYLRIHRLGDNTENIEI